MYSLIWAKFRVCAVTIMFQITYSNSIEFTYSKRESYSNHMCVVLNTDVDVVIRLYDLLKMLLIV
jgi:hypothetical protein